MSIYKHTAPVNKSNQEIDLSKQANSLEVGTTDDSYEYFSDKDEADFHKRKNRNNLSPKTP